MSQLFQLEARASEVSLAGPGSCVTPLVSEATSALSVPDTSLQETAEVRERLESVQVCIIVHRSGQDIYWTNKPTEKIFSFLIFT